jgi:dTDP-4-dehydrorhamnose 3,5-epimerase
MAKKDSMKVFNTEIPDVKIVEPNIYADERGHFLETYKESRYLAAGIGNRYVQDNLSVSYKGVLRGLHFQNPNPQGKLVSVLQGEVYDVAVDLRVNSPTFGKWIAVILSDSNRRQLWIPAGFAHGFQTVSEKAIFVYKCDNEYHQTSEHSLRWNDPSLGIPWPIEKPVMSAKDREAPLLQDLDEYLFRN